MIHKVLIDEQALGWIKENEERVSSEYEIVFKVGDDQAPEPGSKDKEIGIFCEEENCNLITGDYTAYLDILENPPLAITTSFNAKRKTLGSSSSRASFR